MNLIMLKANSSHLVIEGAVMCVAGSTNAAASSCPRLQMKHPCHIVVLAGQEK